MVIGLICWHHRYHQMVFITMIMSNFVNLLNFLVQEIRDQKPCICATVALDHSGVDLNNKVANAIYEDCRKGQLTIPHFPNFDPLIQALKSGGATDRTKSFRVSAQRHNHLLLLETCAGKWVRNEATADRAKEIIQEHNVEYNPTGDYWISESMLYLILN